MRVREGRGVEAGEVGGAGVGVGVEVREAHQVGPPPPPPSTLNETDEAADRFEATLADRRRDTALPPGPGASSLSLPSILYSEERSDLASWPFH